MKNVYGTEEYEKQKEAYSTYIGTNFTLAPEIEERSFLYEDIRINMSVYSYSNEKHSVAERSLLTVLRNDKEIYTVNCFDDPMSPLMFKYENNDYMAFRKTLFGYSLINLDTLQEYNYFPEEGINGEAYIAVKAFLFKDILILGGCYWGGPYGYYFARLFTDNTYYFSAGFDSDGYFEASDTKEPLILDDSVVLFDNNGRSKEISYSEILQMLE